MPTDHPPLIPASLVERQILEAMERGEFDDLPGSGRPIEELERPYDPGWWARRWVRRERLLDEARELRNEITAVERRLRAAGRDEEAAERLATAARELGRINRLLPPEDRLPPLAE
jgi:hypothetical protein